MPKLHGKLTKVYVNGVDVSTYFNNADTPQTADAAESSGFNSEDKTYVSGMKSGTMRLQGHYDNAPTGHEKTFFDALGGAANPIVSIVMRDLVEARGWTAEALETGIAVSAPIGGVVAMNVDFQSTDGIKAMRTIQTGNLATDGAATAEYNGGADTSYGMTAVLHALSNVGGTPVFTIEDSANGSSGWATVLTFASFTAAGEAQIVEITGTVKPFLRPSVAGGSANVYIGVNQPIG